MMMLNIGRKVVYPCQGPCLVSSIEKKIINDVPVMFYQLLVLAEGGGKLFIPVEKAKTVGIRPMLKKADVPKVLGKLQKSSESAEDYRQRARDNSKLFASGSAFDLAEIIESLTELGETKSLSISERKALDKARMLLVCELSEVMGETRQESERQIDEALRVRKDVTAAIAV